MQTASALTVKEQREWNRLQDLWATRRATSKQILRVMALARKASNPERKETP